MEIKYPFYSKVAKIFNSGQSRTILLSGNIHDLFYNGAKYVPIIDYLTAAAEGTSLIPVIYELNAPVRFIASDVDKTLIEDSWCQWRITFLKRLATKTELDKAHKEFNEAVLESSGNPTFAMEFMRQLAICSRTMMKKNFLIIIEAADMLLPAGNGDIAQLQQGDRYRVRIASDWFSDPEFTNAETSVILLAESASQIHPRVSRLPQIISVDVPSPNLDERKDFIYRNVGSFVDLTQGSSDDYIYFIAKNTAGLSIHAIKQLLLSKPKIEINDITEKVEDFIQSQLGDDVVEFKKPSHTLKDVVGFAILKEFAKNELIPRIKADGDESLSGAAVAGPIGGGKTFVFEAIAAELDIPVLVLKNLRSKWFGETDVIFERLKRVIGALEKVLIFMDEADTQFGGVGQDAHETERRLTGKLQQMMSDTKLKGKVIWLLMTARINCLSPDLRRPGRAGDLIIPVLDPSGPDRTEFIKWTVKPANFEITEDQFGELDRATSGPYSAASFSSLRSHIKAKKPKNFQELIDITRDLIPPDIEETRRYQTLQALLNCTRLSLLPNGTDETYRKRWREELSSLELKGIR